MNIHLEKLLIISSNPFMGYDILNTFDVEVYVFKNTIIASIHF